jgi:hypothetical protein
MTNMVKNNSLIRKKIINKTPDKGEDENEILTNLNNQYEKDYLNIYFPYSSCQS